MSKNKKNYPSMMAITGAVDPSHAVFFSSLDEDGKVPLSKQEVSVLGTMGDYKSFKNDKLKEPHGNLQSVDVCFLPNAHDTLHVVGNIKFSNQIESIISNSPEYTQKLKDIYNEFSEKGALSVLAKRWLVQIIKGAPLFRNKWSPNIKLLLNNKEINVVQSLDLEKGETVIKDYGLEKEVELIEKALSGSEGDIFILEYEYIVPIGHGQEVYPSQELTINYSGNKGKVLFDLPYKNSMASGMHSQKIGNAIRTIDTWWSEEKCHPIPVDPFGPDKGKGVYRRNVKGKNIYDIIENAVEPEENIHSKNEELKNNDLYLMASLIRGGVYGLS